MNSTTISRQVLPLTLVALAACMGAAPLMIVEQGSVNQETTKSIRSDGKLINGIREEKWFFFYEGGAPLARGDYRDGLKDGPWQYWRESGELWLAGEYDIFDIQGASYSKPVGLWIVFADGEVLDRADHSSLKCKEGDLVRAGYWAHRIDWLSFSQEAIEELTGILPRGLSFDGPGFYKDGVRWEVLTEDAFMRASSKVK